MPLSTQSLLVAYKLPEDAVAEHDAVCQVIRAARAALDIRMFGFTDESKADALGDAVKAGVALRMILDRQQAQDPAEKILLAYLLGTCGVPAACLQFRDGLRGAYMHDKLVVKDAGADVPDGQYDDLASALAAGYPTTVAGSTNWSRSAYRAQDNLTMILPGKVLASWLAADFALQWNSPMPARAAPTKREGNP